MAKQYLIVLLIFITVFGSSCVQNTKPQVKEAGLKWSMQEKKAKDCLDSTLCAEFVAKYPLFEGESALAKQLNKEVNLFVTGLVAMEVDTNTVFSIDSSSTHFVSSFRETIKEYPDHSVSWAVEMQSEVPFQNDRFITLDRDAYSFMGGAHPNSFRNITTYRIATGQPVGLHEVITDTTALKTILEARYKAEKGVDAKTDLKELTFDGSPITLPANFALVPKGVLFYYNDYEVASHAVGPTEIIMTWEELGALADQVQWK